MRIVNPEVRFTTAPPTTEQLYALIETAGRICYKSEPKEGDTPEAFIRRRIAQGHEALIEHSSISLTFICDRGVSHELVRHRLFSFCQESTRFCNYGLDKFGKELSVIKPCYLEEGSAMYRIWKRACETAEIAYFDLLNEGATAQEARAVLPNSLKTEVVVTGNVREWRHFFNLRKFGKAGTPHPQMVEVADKAWDLVYPMYPALFEDLFPVAG